jgi:hypothetical protein
MSYLFSDDDARWCVPAYHFERFAENLLALLAAEGDHGRRRIKATAFRNAAVSEKFWTNAQKEADWDLDYDSSVPETYDPWLDQ